MHASHALTPKLSSCDTANTSCGTVEGSNSCCSQRHSIAYNALAQYISWQGRMALSCDQAHSHRAEQKVSTASQVVADMHQTVPTVQSLHSTFLSTLPPPLHHHFTATFTTTTTTQPALQQGICPHQHAKQHAPTSLYCTQVCSWMFICFSLLMQILRCSCSPDVWPLCKCRLASREFPEALPTKRALRTAPARGHIYSVQFHEGARHEGARTAVDALKGRKSNTGDLAISPRATDS